MKTKYCFFPCCRRIAALLFLGMVAFSGILAQTFNNANYIKVTQDLQVVHKQSFLADRADNMDVSFPPEFLQKNEGWKTNEYGKQVQNTSDYYTTRYVKKGTWAPLFLTTKQNTTTSDHKYYQRWYYYDSEGNELPLPEEYYAPEFKAYVYSNGLVMGERLYNYKNSNATTQNLTNGTTPVETSLLCRLPQNLETLEIGGDITRYSDMTYQNAANTGDANARAAASGNLTEPSLTIRHHYLLIDANVMARKLTSKTYGGDEWLEEHTIHFPNKTIGLRYDHVSLDLELQDYWFYRGGVEAEGNLQNILSDNYITYEFYYPGGTNLGLRNLGLIDAPNSNRNNNYSNITDTEVRRRRLIKFDYPSNPNGVVAPNSKVEIRVYARESNAADARKYNLARFTLIFDESSEVVPWMDVIGENAPLYKRSPESLRLAVGGADPVAHIDFDYPGSQYFKNPPTGLTKYHANGNPNPNTSFTYSSALPLSFKHTNYGYAPLAQDNVYNWCVWGEYGIGKETGQSVTNSSATKVYPVSRKTGEVLNSDLESGFLYIDASDLPGTVASVPFQGTFCMGTKMMCSGWITSLTDNKIADTSRPGSVVLKVIGTKPDGNELEIYTYCPGQVGNYYRRYSAAPGTLTKSSGEYCWQQFYFEFFLQEPCVSYELRVDNYCESTSGGDYFLDDIWVFAQLPVVGPEMTTPLCGGNLEVIQLETNFESLLLSTGKLEATSHETAEQGYLSFIYLDWDNFLLRFKEGLANVHGINVSAHDLQENINSGVYDNDLYRDIYHTAFSESIIRDTLTHKVIFGNYTWSNYYEDQPEFSFAQMAMDTQHTVYRMTSDGKRRLVFNGYMGYDVWEYYHNYALLTTIRSSEMTEAEAENSDWISDFLFNVLNECSNRSILWFAPKIEILGTIGGMSIEDLEFCQFTTQTFAMELAGYTRTEGYVDENGEHQPGDYVLMHDVYFDWWMGLPKSDANPDGVPATVENYMQQYITYTEDGLEKRLYLYDAVRCFRFMNPDITDINSPNIRLGQNPLYTNIPAFTQRMLDYLRSLASPSDGSKPQLFTHTQIVDIQINEDNVFPEIYLGDTIKYVKFVAIPIEANLNQGVTDFVYICAEPQPFRVKVGKHAPQMTVGFSEKHYPANLGTLSVRISKSQFEKLVDHEDGTGYSELHIPLRSIDVVTPNCYGVKTPDNPNDNLRYVRIANSTDALMQQYIMDNIILDESNSWPPVCGKTDYLVGKHDNYWPADYTYPNEYRMLKMHFNKDFQVREGYSYTLRYYFIEDLNSGLQLTCNGNADIIIKIVPDYEVWTGGADNTDWSNDENWRRADYDELYAGNGTTLKNNYLPNGKEGDNPQETNFITPADRERMQGFAPLYCTNILMMTGERKDAAVLYDDGDEMETQLDGEGNPVLDGDNNPIMTPTGFPALRSTSSPLIRYDFQTHEWDSETMSVDGSGVSASFRVNGDMITELYSTNVCDAIVFQSETELINAHLLNYNKAWVEFALPKNKWHLVSSPLQGTISGEWYAPTWSARQETTYFEPIDFNVKPVTSITSSSGTYNLDYDRFAPAVYQRQWDKAKAVLYERGAVWSAEDASQTGNLGEDEQGDWSSAGQGFSWDSSNADEYLNRLVYKPFGDSKVNVAVRGSWSGAHNDHTVPYDNGGFSVMPINNLKTYNDESVKTIFRLPKDDQYYDIWDWGKSYVVERRVRVYINDGRPLPTEANETNTVSLNNRGRLRSDYFAANEDGVYEVTLKNEGEGSMGYFLASNPFICGLDMEKFFVENADSVYPYYLVMKGSNIDPQMPEMNPTDWKWTDMTYAGQTDGTNFVGNAVVPPRYAFFLKKKDNAAVDMSTLTLKYTADMMVSTPKTTENHQGGGAPNLRIRAERDGNTSEATVMLSPDASNKFLPEEDLETFVVSDISSKIPVIYTLTGRLATSINRIHDFMVLPIGIESNSNKHATVTFEGVENLGDNLMLYDAMTEELLSLKSGVKVRMPGRTQNRFFIVKGENLQEAIDESNLQIFAGDGSITVSSATNQPITEVRVYDAGGRQVYVATPNRADHYFSLSEGIYVVRAKTDSVQQTKKVHN